MRERFTAGVAVAGLLVSAAAGIVTALAAVFALPDVLVQIAGAITVAGLLVVAGVSFIQARTASRSFWGCLGETGRAAWWWITVMF
jgi:hypothetical protein